MKMCSSKDEINVPIALGAFRDKNTSSPSLVLLKYKSKCVSPPFKGRRMRYQNDFISASPVTYKKAFGQLAEIAL